MNTMEQYYSISHSSELTRIDVVWIDWHEYILSLHLQKKQSSIIIRFPCVVHLFLGFCFLSNFSNFYLISKDFVLENSYFFRKRIKLLPQKKVDSIDPLALLAVFFLFVFITLTVTDIYIYIKEHTLLFAATHYIANISLIF